MSERTNRLAVSAVETAALKLGWFFRSQEVSDQGIDAHIEKFDMLPGNRGQLVEVGTGRLLAVQIKGGPSYFERPSPNGWWFSFAENKAKLWLNHALPVIVVLVDLAGEEIYWERVGPRTVVKAGKTYKIEVPRRQRVSGADTEWVEIASGLERHATSRFEYSLQSLPPDVARTLGQRGEAELADAALLAMHLSEGRRNPRGTVESLLAADPVWLLRNASWSWAVVGNYASDHNLHDQASEAYQRSAAAATGGQRTRSLVSAATHIRAAEPSKSASLLQEAEADPADDLMLAIGRTVLSTPPGDAGPLTVDPLLVSGDERVSKSVTAQRGG